MKEKSALGADMTFAALKRRTQTNRFTVRIPAKANAVPKGSRTVFRAEAEHHRSVATLAF